jgi:DNA-binding NarL/FixJ family response regulator
MSIKIIIADDHRVLRDGLKAILEKAASIQVIGEAENGLQAVQMTRQLAPDVVLMDIHMPELDGVEAAREITSSRPDTKIIILSMYATKEHIYQAFQAGARGYLLKETSGLEVVEAIQTVADGQRFLSASLTDRIIDGYLAKRESSPPDSPLDSLSSRERQVLTLVVQGKTSQEIADRLHLAVSTVSTYRSRLMKKLDVDNLADLIKFAVDHHLVDSG